VLEIGAGGLWQEIAKLGVGPRSPAQGVRAMEEAILVRALIYNLPAASPPRRCPPRAMTLDGGSVVRWFGRPIGAALRQARHSDAAAEPRALP